MNKPMDEEGNGSEEWALPPLRLRFRGSPVVAGSPPPPPLVQLDRVLPLP